MPKNIGGGKKYKKRKTNTDTGPGRIMYPDTDQLYGVVTKRLGGGLLDLLVCDTRGTVVRKVRGRIRGILRKRRVCFEEGSIVIATERPFGNKDGEKEKVDVIHKYFDEHVRILIKHKLIPDEMRRTNTFTEPLNSKTKKDVSDEDEMFEFVDDMIDDI